MKRAGTVAACVVALAVAALVVAGTSCGDEDGTDRGGGARSGTGAAPEARDAAQRARAPQPVASPDEVAATPASATGRVRCRVVAAAMTRGEDTPIPGARSRAFAVAKGVSERSQEEDTLPMRDPPDAQATADAQGEATLDLDPSKKWLVVADAASGSLAPEAEYVRQDDPSRLTLRLWPSETCTVIVVDHVGRPVAGAEVRCSTHLGEFPSQWVCTGADGTVTLRRVEDARVGFALNAVAPGLRTDGIDWNDDGDAPFVIHMAPGGVLAGRVTDREGRPVAGAVVHWRVAATRTAADGTFRLAALPPHSEELQVRARGYVEASSECFPGREDLEIRLARKVRVAGEVLLPDGTPAARAVVRTNAGAEVTADDFGWFEADVEEHRGHALVQWREPGGEDRRGPGRFAVADFVPNPAAGPSGLRIVLDRESSWACVLVTDRDAKRLKDASLVIRAPGAESWLRTGDDGCAEDLLAVPPGTAVEVEIRGTTDLYKNDFAPARQMVTTLAAAGEPTRIALERMPAHVADAARGDSRLLRGRVLDPDGRPCAGAAVDMSAAGAFLGGWESAAATDSAGRFELTVADVEQIWVSARLGGCGPGFRSVDTRPDPPPAVELRLASPGSVRLLLSPADGLVSRCDVAAPDGPPSWRADVRRTGEGDERIDDLPSGRWSFRVGLRKETREFEADVRAGETTVVELRR